MIQIPPKKSFLTIVLLSRSTLKRIITVWSRSSPFTLSNKNSICLVLFFCWLVLFLILSLNLQCFYRNLTILKYFQRLSWDISENIRNIIWTEYWETYVTQVNKTISIFKAGLLFYTRLSPTGSWHTYLQLGELLMSEKGVIFLNKSWILRARI